MNIVRKILELQDRIKCLIRRVIALESAPIASDEKVKYDAGDPTPGYVADKFVAGTGIGIAEGTGANENKLKITNTLDLSEYGKSALEVEYSQLDTLISNGALEIGRCYKITDYQTVHTISGTGDTNTGPIEPLIVTAILVNELAPIAYSTLYPDDIIYYHSGTDENNFPGATKGYISRRIDTIQNNDIGTDWRVCKYRRYKISESNWLEGTTYSKGQVAKRSTGTTAQQKEIYISLKNDNIGHSVTDTNWWRRFEWDNESYSGITSGDWYICDDGFTLTIHTTSDYQDKLLFTYTDNIVNNVIKTYKLMNVTVGTYFSNNNIGTEFIYNSIGNGFSNNSIGNDISYNSIGTNFHHNNINSSFSNNSITGSSFYGNNTGNNFNNNSIGYGFSNNSIGNDFNSNSIGDTFNSNSINNNFSNNAISSGFNSNSIGYFFNNNIIGNDFSDNFIGNNFSSNFISDTFSNNICLVMVESTNFIMASYVYERYTKEFFVREDRTVRLRFTNNLDKITVVSITD